MRSTYVLAASLLLMIFSFLSNETQGIRLGNGMKPIGQLEKALAEESPLIEEGFGKIIILCKHGHCNSGNYIRKLLTATSPSSPSLSTTTNEEGNKKGKPMSKKEEVNVSTVKEKDLDNSEAISENLEGTGGLGHYPDLVDIAEMDYSPAKRKPPIHN